MQELTHNVDADDLEIGQTVFAFDKEAGEYRETEISELEDVGLYTAIHVEDDAANFDPSGYTASDFDYETGDWAYLALPENVEEVADAFADYTGKGIEIVEDDEDEPEIVTDGGEDVTDHVEDDEIENAIERHDDPGHPNALSVEEVRDQLAEIQLSFGEFWNEHMDTLEDGGLEVVEDTGDVVVFADHTGHGWNEELKAVGADDVSRSVIMSVHHAVADRLTDYSWSTSDPIVVRKPNGDGGQRYVEAVVNSLINEGLSPGQAWAVYGVHVAGHSRNGWASMCGYSDHSAVSEPLRKVNEKTPHIALVD